MCFSQSAIIGLNSYNWDGDRIDFDPIVPSHRAVVGKPSKTYQLDVREFLTGDYNAVMRKTVEEDVKRFGLSVGADMDLFSKRGEGGFDYRASLISQFVGHTIHYRTRKHKDPWRFPEETLMINEGDCEDIAFLLASLLFTAGISPYNIRVAFGKVKTTIDGKKKDFDHAWVMYKRESGKWMVLEPLDLLNNGKSKKKQSKSSVILLPNTSSCIYEYQPRFLFNWQHLWVIDNGLHKNKESLKTMVSREWKRMDPSFAGLVHRNILHEALSDLPADKGWIIKELNKRFTHIIPFYDATLVDNPDMPWNYHPYDHFDSGFIDEGWGRVKDRLSNVKANNNAIGNFAWAAHGIADFYAHSSYVQFAKLINPKIDDGYAMAYDPDDPSACIETTPEYNSGIFNFNKFKINSSLYQGNNNQAAKLWHGQLISGRYAQRPDSRSHGMLESLAKVPTDVRWGKHAALPHHDEIAVDEPKAKEDHKLYPDYSNKDDPSQQDDRQYYDNQYRWRYRSAVNHIRQSFLSNWPS